MPNATPVTIVRAIANPTTRTSMDGVSAIGNAVGTRRERIGRVAAASARPSTPPVPVTTRLSVSSCRSTRSRPAPSAMRTAISRRRTIARASRRLVRFAHAINSTHTAAPNSATSSVRLCCDTPSRRRITLTPVCSFSSDTAVAAGRPAWTSRSAPRRRRHHVATGQFPADSCGCDRRSRRNEAHRRPELGATAGEVEVARHDANDGVDLPVEAHGAPHDRRITTELLLPERIAHQCRRWRAIDVVRRRERPADHRAHGKRGENIGGHGRPLQTERLPRADQIHREPAIGAERFERGRHLFQVAVVGRRELHARKARTLFREPHQTIGLRKRQRSNQHEIGERERCGRRADAKRDDGDRGQGKRRRAAQRPQRVAQVLPEDVPVDAGGIDAGISDHAQPQRGHAERGSRVSPFARKTVAISRPYSLRNDAG